MGEAIINHNRSSMKPIPTGVEPSRIPLEGIKAVIFDIYGTLFMSSSGGVNMLKKIAGATDQLGGLLSRYNIDMTPDQLVDAFAAAVNSKHDELKKCGIDFPEIHQDRIFMQLLDLNEMDTVRAFVMEFEQIVNPVYPMPNLKKTLLSLRAAGLILGIISNAQFYTPSLFNRFLNDDAEGLGFHTELLFYSYQFGFAKPSISLFQEAAKTLSGLGLKAGEVLYVGNDMLNDICPANTVGFKTCLFAGDARSLRMREEFPDCRNLKPDAVVTDLSQIIDLI